MFHFTDRVKERKKLFEKYRSYFHVIKVSVNLKVLELYLRFIVLPKPSPSSAQLGTCIMLRHTSSDLK